MARYNIITNARVSLPPTRLGTRSIPMPHGTTYTLLQTDFINTIPSYQDPDGDLPSILKVLTLPSTGTLQLNNVNVTVNQEISFASIINRDLTFTAPSGTITAFISDFNFDIADEGSLTFANLIGTISFNVAAKINLPPSSVGNNSRTVAYGSVTVFSTNDFTALTTPAYSDPEGDAAENLKILALPVEGRLTYNGFSVTLNQIIPFSGIANGNLVYTANGPVEGYNSYFDFSIADSGSKQFTE